MIRVKAVEVTETFSVLQLLETFIRVLDKPTVGMELEGETYSGKGGVFTDRKNLVELLQEKREELNKKLEQL
jgi:hypothetical protein